MSSHLPGSRELLDDFLQLRERHWALAVPRHQRRGSWRKFQAGSLHLLSEIGKQSHIAVSINGCEISFGIARNSESTLLDASRARQPVFAGLIEQQQQFLSLAIAGSVVFVADVPDELPERERGSRGAFQILLDPQGHNHGAEIGKLGMGFDVRAHHLSAHDRGGLLGQLRDVPGSRQRPSLRQQRAAGNQPQERCSN